MYTDIDLRWQTDPHNANEVAHWNHLTFYLYEGYAGNKAYLRVSARSGRIVFSQQADTVGRGKALAQQWISDVYGPSGSNE